MLVDVTLSSPTLGLRPPMPYGDQDAERRRQHQEDRLRVILEEHDQIAADWMAEQMDDELSAAKGPPDLSVNTLLFNGRQQSALYDTSPDAAHADDAAQALIGPGGYLDSAGYWTGQQWTQLVAVTVGDCIRVPEVYQDGDQRVFLARHVMPHNVWVRASAADPRRAVELWELRIRTIDDGQGNQVDRYAWDVYRIDGPSPYYRVLVPGGSDESGYEDRTQEVHKRTFEGTGYIWRLRGVPFVPHVFFSAVPDGYLMHAGYNRGAYHGAMNSIFHWTGLNRAMGCTMMPFLLCWGIKAPGTKTRAAGTSQATQGLTILPGSLVFCAIDPENGGIAPGTKEITPGPYLETLLKGAIEYEVQQGGRWGAGESSAQKSGASPWSGAALTISNHDRRLGQRKMLPAFQVQDLLFLRNAAAVLMAWGMARGLPTDGYSITYHEIPLTPEEQEQERLQLDWEESKGIISKIARYQRLHPGASVETAKQALIQAALQDADLEAAIEEALTAAGYDPEEDKDDTTPDPDEDPDTTTTRTGNEAGKE